MDSQARSKLMSRIRGRDTQPELQLRRMLHALGFRFRLCQRGLPGSPDIVLKKWNAVIFVHGCFWHRHANCKHAAMPKSRPEFWVAKFEANLTRDQAVQNALVALGWRIGVVWECGLKADAERVTATLADWITSPTSTRIEIGQPP